ncbi:MAG TPA: cytochrome b/b6 domain-containing protein [Sphingomicrobium sp.]|nr:cytochrome b/b6 domain-containing protein [Sphingomicrobium sp.]
MSRHLPRGGAALSQRVWDLPVRLVHWLLVTLVAFSWWSVHHHHTDWHIWSGCAILTLLIFRILWGFFGSSTARFSSFVRGPRAVGDHWRGQWAGIGHNPLGALSVLALLAAIAVQVGLGLVSQDEDGIYMGPLALLVSSSTSDKARDLHELWFNVILGLIVLHLAAIIFYRLKGKKLTLPMITGRAAIVPGFQPMRPGKWWVAVICFGVGIGITRWIIAGLPPFGS